MTTERLKLRIVFPWWWCCYDDAPRPPLTEWFTTEAEARAHMEHVLREGAEWAHVGVCEQAAEEAA